MRHRLFWNHSSGLNACVHTTRCLSSYWCWPSFERKRPESFEQGANLLKSLGSSTESALGGGASQRRDHQASKKRLSRDRKRRRTAQSGGRVNNDANIRIPLPDTPTSTRCASAVRLRRALDDLEVRRRAAEDATPKADSILGCDPAMTLEDANASTKVRRRSHAIPKRTMSTPLLILAAYCRRVLWVGAIEAYDNALGQYSKLPFMPDVKADLSKTCDRTRLGRCFPLSCEGRSRHP